MKLLLYITLLLFVSTILADDVTFTYDVNEDTTSFSQEWDFIVIGSGAAGSVVASRLSENPTIKVLLLEAGGPSQRATGSKQGGTFKYKPDGNNTGKYVLDGSWTRYDVPLLYQSIVDPALNYQKSGEWTFQGYPASAAKVLGGSMAHNGMLWLRAIPQNFASWGVTGWSYNEVLPYFKKSENVSSYRVPPGDPYHGFSGPIQITDPAVLEEEDAIVCNATVNAGLGVYIKDFNRGDVSTTPGCGYQHNNIRAGVRDSSVVAYIFNTAVINRPNLRVRAYAQVTKVIFQGKTATGVQVADLKTGIKYTVNAKKAVILSAGALNSPKVLLQSGIGPAATLASLGIPIVLNNSNVGQRVQNTPYVFVHWAANNQTHPNFYNYFFEAQRYAKNQTGFLASTGSSGAAYLKTLNSSATPDIFVFFYPQSAGFYPQSAGDNYIKQLTLVLLVTDPQPGTATVTITSNDPLADNVLYNQNYSTPAHTGDIAAMVRAIKQFRTIMSYPPANTYFSHETLPGPSVVTDAQLADFVRSTVTEGYHYVNSVRMGNPSDPQRVLDNHTRVVGVNKLYVVDASIFPGSTHGFTQATTVAAAERAVAFIRSDFGL